jgi:4-amino-4-deoxy-L-arabinose transferase-like glycosyltransferase
VISGLIRGIRDRVRPSGFGILLTCWFAVGMVFLSISAFKHKHYAIPILPPLSVLAAIGVARQIHGSRPGPRSATFLGAMALAMGGAIGVGAALATAGPASLVLKISLLVLISGVGIGLASHLRRVGRPERATLALFGVIWLCVVMVRSTVLPPFDLYRDQTALARRTNDQLPPSVPIYMVESNLTQMTYYLRPPLLRFDDWHDFARVVSEAPADEPLYTIAPEKLLAELESLGEVRVLDHSSTFNHMQVIEIRQRPRPVASGPKSTR